MEKKYSAKIEHLNEEVNSITHLMSQVYSLKLKKVISDGTFLSIYKTLLECLAECDLEFSCIKKDIEEGEE